jgi:hypothetical protein
MTPSNIKHLISSNIKHIGSKVGKSLGARGPETEAILSGFKEGRERNARRLGSLGQEMDREAAILRGLGAWRVPQVAARILREIRDQRQGRGSEGGRHQCALCL